MDMRIDSARHNQLARRIDDFGIRGVELVANRQDCLTLDENIGFKSIRGGDDGSVLDEFFWGHSSPLMPNNIAKISGGISTSGTSYLAPLSARSRKACQSSLRSSE